MGDKFVLAVTDDPGLHYLLDLLFEDEENLGAAVLDRYSDLPLRIRERKPDLLVLDLCYQCTPEGLAAVREFRKSSVTAATPVLALVPWYEARREALAAGCDVCLEKPFDIATLMAKIRGLLTPREREAAA